MAAYFDISQRAKRSPLRLVPRPPEPESHGKKAFAIAALVLVILSSIAFSYAEVFGPVGPDAVPRAFVVEPDETSGQIANRLAAIGLIRSVWAFRLAYAHKVPAEGIRPGGYELSESMDVWTIAATLGRSPYIAWITIPRGVRKEQIADMLAKALSWSPELKQAWLAAAAAASIPDGIYYPDTYLVPSDQPPAQIAARMRSRFSQVSAELAAEAAKQGLSWSSVLTMASLIEREAAGPDRALIAGILWNRIHKGMLLQVDATLQYVKGNAEDGWWGTVHSEDKYLASPYNTYENVGLPPAPIAEPSLEAIAAVLHPEKTSCLYYLHDYKGQIHCSANYAGQVANVNKYLR